jgi:hypothetical protein
MTTNKFWILVLAIVVSGCAELESKKEVSAPVPRDPVAEQYTIDILAAHAKTCGSSIGWDHAYQSRFTGFYEKAIAQCHRDFPNGIPESMRSPTVPEGTRIDQQCTKSRNFNGCVQPR